MESSPDDQRRPGRVLALPPHASRSNNGPCRLTPWPPFALGSRFDALSARINELLLVMHGKQGRGTERMHVCVCMCTHREGVGGVMQSSGCPRDGRV